MKLEVPSLLTDEVRHGGPARDERLLQEIFTTKGPQR